MFPAHQQSRKTTARAREDDDVWAFTFTRLPRNVAWQDLKDYVRKAGGRYPRDAQKWETADGDTIAYCLVRGEEATYRCWNKLVSKGLDGQKVDVGLLRKVNGRLVRVHAWVQAPRRTSEGHQSRPDGNSLQNQGMAVSGTPHLSPRSSESYRAATNVPLQSSSAATGPAMTPRSTTIHASHPPLFRNATNAGDISASSELLSVARGNALGASSNAVIIKNLSPNVQPSDMQNLLRNRFRLPSLCKSVGKAEIKATFAYPKHAQSACRQLNGLDFHGRLLRVRTDQVVCTHNQQTNRSHHVPRPEAPEFVPSSQLQLKKPPIVCSSPYDDESLARARRARNCYDSDEEPAGGF